MHPDMVLSLNAIAETASSTAQPPFVRNKLANMINSDYESDPGLKITDIHTASGAINNMHNDSDTEEVSYPAVHTHPSDQETIPSPGRPLGEVAGYTKLNKAMTNDSSSPFSSEEDFNFASWFVRSKVAKSQINAYFAEDLGDMDSRSFRSASTL